MAYVRKAKMGFKALKPGQKIGLVLLIIALIAFLYNMIKPKVSPSPEPTPIDTLMKYIGSALVPLLMVEVGLLLLPVIPPLGIGFIVGGVVYAAFYLYSLFGGDSMGQDNNALPG